MLRFFRQIRQNLLTQNKFSKYLLYAIGEILLVVIGILIALQIDNWNEEKKERQRLNDFLTEIQNDLSDDILKANDFIDDYIAKDSILRNIRLDKVSYSIEKYTENRQSLLLIYESENFRLQSKGYDGLVQNIDNIPKKYKNLMDMLNFIYVTNRYDLESMNKRLEANTYDNIDDLKSKDWSVDFWDWRLNDDMITYFESDSYKNEAVHYSNNLWMFIKHIVQFKITAIETYKEIAGLKSENAPMPKHVSYTYPEPETLSHFAGKFEIFSRESSELGVENQEEFLIEDNQLKWHYSYEDINLQQDFNIPLYWHKNNIFFNFQVPAIWEFNVENESKVIFTGRSHGQWDRYEKVMPKD